jgi:hypothetical protein
VGQDKLAGNGQSQAAALPNRLTTSAPESQKEVGQVVRLDTFPGIFNLQEEAEPVLSCFGHALRQRHLSGNVSRPA